MDTIFYSDDNHFSIFDVPRFLSLFEDEVKAELYKPISYSVWRDLKSKIRLDVSYCVGNEKINIYNPNPPEYVYSFNIEDDSLGNFIYHNYFINKPKEKKVKEEKTMKNFNFNFDFGSCADDSVRMSMYGLAVKNAAGTYVSYNPTTKQIVDVDIMNFDGGKYIFKIPVALSDVAEGDIVIHNRKPMFVVSVDNNNLTVIDIHAGEKKEIIPTTNMFNFNFVTKVVSLLNFGTPTADKPFGNMLPFLMMDGEEDIDPMMLYLMMGDTNLNPMMFMLMSKGENKDNMKDIMLLSLMMNGNNPFINTTVSQTNMPISQIPMILSTT